jgi:hypothetical protein
MTGKTQKLDRGKDAAGCRRLIQVPPEPRAKWSPIIRLTNSAWGGVELSFHKRKHLFISISYSLDDERRGSNRCFGHSPP